MYEERGEKDDRRCEGTESRDRCSSSWSRPSVKRELVETLPPTEGAIFFVEELESGMIARDATTEQKERRRTNHPPRIEA